MQNIFSFTAQEGKRKHMAQFLVSFVLFASIFLASLSFVSAQGNPFQSSNTIAGLEISIPPETTIPLHQPYTINVQAFNLSNGVPIFSGLSCYVHVYNPDGTHILKLKTATITDTNDYEFTIPANNLTTSGAYFYTSWCNSSVQGGFASQALIVTSEGTSSLYIQIIIFLVIIVVLLALGINLQDNWILVLAGALLVFFGLYTLINGFDSYKSTTTYAISLIVIFLGSYIAIRAGIEEVNK